MFVTSPRADLFTRLNSCPVRLNAFELRNRAAMLTFYHFHRVPSRCSPFDRIVRRLSFDSRFDRAKLI